MQGYGALSIQLKEQARTRHSPSLPFMLGYFIFISSWISGRGWREKGSWVCLWLTLQETMETLLGSCGQTFVPLLNWLVYYIFKHKVNLPGIFVSPLNQRKENSRVNRHFWEQPIQRPGKSMEHFESDFEVIAPRIVRLRRFEEFSVTLLMWFS